jgi:hypothetical protein
MANRNVQITKRSFSTTDGSLVSKWCLFVEHNQALYIHLPSVGMSNLKNGTGERECNLRKTSIWLKQDRKCPACQGKKLAYHKATAHKDQCYGPDACPRCQGKGWWSLSDEKRWEVYQEARFCEEGGVEYNPSYSTPYQAQAAKVAAVKARMNAAAETVKKPAWQVTVETKRAAQNDAHNDVYNLRSVSDDVLKVLREAPFSLNFEEVYELEMKVNFGFEEDAEELKVLDLLERAHLVEMERRYEAKPLTEYQRKAARVAHVKARMNAQASANNHAVGDEVLMNLQDAVA